MKSYAAAMIAVLLAFCLILTAAFAVLTSRVRMGLESLAGTIGESSPEAFRGYADALICTAVSEGNAEKGREALESSGYLTFPAEFFTKRLIPEGMVFAFGAAALAVIGGAAAFFAVKRRRTIRREAELDRRINDALRGQDRFSAENADERRLAKLFGEISRLNALRESYAAELREYVENVAHEIKSPTSGILLNLDLMERGGISGSRLDAARKCAMRISAYVAGLLSLARLRSGRVRMSFEPADLGGIARETAHELAANGIETVVTGEGAEINCDKTRIKEAIRNLIVNASKHQEEGEPVRVELERGDYDVTLRVTDNGPGMKDDALIERYTVGNEDGTSFGIGLSLAREVAARHSGKLLIKKPENGSAIELVIPRFDLKKSIETE